MGDILSIVDTFTAIAHPYPNPKPRHTGTIGRRSCTGFARYSVASVDLNQRGRPRLVRKCVLRTLGTQKTVRPRSRSDFRCLRSTQEIVDCGPTPLNSIVDTHIASTEWCYTGGQHSFHRSGTCSDGMCNQILGKTYNSAPTCETKKALMGSSRGH